MDNLVTFEEVLRLATKVLLKDKVKLIEEVAHQIQRDIQPRIKTAPDTKGYVAPT